MRRMAARRIVAGLKFGITVGLRWRWRVCGCGICESERDCEIEKCDLWRRTAESGGYK